MVVTKIFQHKDYELHCGASAIDNGRFVPTLVVSKQVWPTRPRTIAMERGDFVTEETAIASAYTQGVDWIRNYG